MPRSCHVRQCDNHCPQATLRARMATMRVLQLLGILAR